MKNIKKLALAVAVTASTSPVFAVAIDTVAITSQFGELNAAQAVIGGLLLVAAGIAITFKWGKGMIFG